MLLIIVFNEVSALDPAVYPVSSFPDSIEAIGPSKAIE